MADVAERAQLEAQIQLLESQNLELRRTVEELRASIRAKDLLLRLPVTGPVADPTAMSHHDYRRQLTDDDIRTSCTGIDE